MGAILPLLYSGRPFGVGSNFFGNREIRALQSLTIVYNRHVSKTPRSKETTMTTTSETTRKYEVLNWANGTPTKAEFKDWDEAFKYATNEAKANKEAGIAGAAAFNAIEIRTYEYTSESLGYLLGMEQEEPEQAEEPKENEGGQAADRDADAVLYTVKYKEGCHWYMGGVFRDRAAANTLVGQFAYEGITAIIEEDGPKEAEDEIAQAANAVMDAGGVVVLPENAEAHDARMRELHRAEDACNEALRKVNKLIDAIEDMKLDCDGEVYDELLAIADVLGR